MELFAADGHDAGGCERVTGKSGMRPRSLNPNVTPPGLRPGCLEGEPQARRCRSRVSVRSSASWAGAQVGRLDPSGAVMRKLVVLANA